MAKQTVQLHVQGMHCQNCVRAVKGSVGALTGVDGVEVNLGGKLVTIGYDPALVGLPALKAAIEDAGYGVV